MYSNRSLRSRFVILTIVSLLMLIPTAGWADNLDTQVKSVSVSVVTSGGSGSGTMFVQGDKTYVLTAGHVVEKLRHVNKVNKDTGNETKEVEVISWDEAKVIQTLYQDDKEVENTVLLAKVVVYSPVEDEGGKDIAVLELLKKNHLKTGATLLPLPKHLTVGQDVIHIGSLYGSITGAYIRGNVARLDYRALHSSFNVINVDSKPGSSGGGIFIKDGDNYYLVGTVVRGDGSGVALTKPLAVIREVLKENNLDDSFNLIPVPAKENCPKPEVKK